MFIIGSNHLNNFASNWLILSNSSYILVVCMSTLKAVYITKKFIILFRLKSTLIVIMRRRGTIINHTQ
ncbi:MAG: hypothetical protein G4A98_02120 [Buchnera aphidicola (Microlophium carnosum)]|uniref:Uncharacterized protein n=1 Tax=Buchnera aphidicola (Microlophium carnosum) TaxID=2708354 RepID=A0A6G9JTA7_9GAMM|nr:MAG: hypothetical protein G4A98_02120 [Buchnera aphidicola (Microlophium carnosum)]